MSLSSAIGQEWAHETGVTRRVLERVPPSSLSWKPHEKSYSMRQLASHLANLPMWSGVVLGADHFDLDSVDAPASGYDTLEEIVGAFDRNVADTLSTIRGMAEDAWSESWSLMRGDAVIFSAPRVAAMRSFVMNHSIHHRGQLTVYLRLSGAPVPQVYGPTADEPDFG